MRLRLVPLAAVVLLAGACAPTASGGGTTSSSPTGPVPSVAAPATSAASSAAPTKATSTPTTIPTASVTHATTAAAATGKVVTLPGSGTEFSTAAAINGTSWLTSDEKSFLVTQLAGMQTSGDSCAMLIVSGYRVADLINGGEFESATAPCTGGGGHAILWGRVSGTWKILVQGQDVPNCSDMRSAGWKTTIPKNFYGGQCYEAGNYSTAVTYKP